MDPGSTDPPPSELKISGWSKMVIHPDSSWMIGILIFTIRISARYSNVSLTPPHIRWFHIIPYFQITRSMLLMAEILHHLSFF